MDNPLEYIHIEISSLIQISFTLHSMLILFEHYVENVHLSCHVTLYCETYSNIFWDNTRIDPFAESKWCRHMIGASHE